MDDFFLLQLDEALAALPSDPDQHPDPGSPGGRRGVKEGAAAAAEATDSEEQVDAGTTEYTAPNLAIFKPPPRVIPVPHKFRNNQGRKDAEEKVHIWHTYRHALMLRCRRGKNSVSFCPLCGHMSKFFSRTLCHMAMMHYKNEIIAEHREELRQWQCFRCPYELTSLSDALMHYGTQHSEAVKWFFAKGGINIKEGMAESLPPMDDEGDSDKENQVGDFSQRDGKIAIKGVVGKPANSPPGHAGTSPLLPEMEEKDSSGAETTSLQHGNLCPFCHQMLPHLFRALGHLSLKHFRLELVRDHCNELSSGDSLLLRCRWCPRYFSDKSLLVIHVGRFHRKALEYLSEGQRSLLVSSLPSASLCDVLLPAVANPPASVAAPLPSVADPLPPVTTIDMVTNPLPSVATPLPSVADPLPSDANPAPSVATVGVVTKPLPSVSDQQPLVADALPTVAAIDMVATPGARRVPLCPDCGVNKRSVKKLTGHMSEVHYKWQIRATLGDIVSCPVCGITVCMRLVRHYGSTHGRILDYVSPQVRELLEAAGVRRMGQD